MISSVKSKAKSFGSSLEHKFEYSYDNNNNRLKTRELLEPSLPPVLVSYVPDVGDSYLSVGGNPVKYDKMGNTLNDGSSNFQYDIFNRIAKVETSTGVTDILRDALARPAYCRRDGEIEKYTFAGTSLIEWTKNGKIEGQAVPLELPNQYAHLACDKNDNAPIFDVISSIIAWVSPEAIVTSRSSDDPYGQVLDRTSKWPGKFGFAGYWLLKDFWP